MEVSTFTRATLPLKGSVHSEPLNQAFLCLLKNQPIKKLVFDLSRNGGGTTAQGSAMIEKLAQMIDTTKTKVYVIVGRRTFSAAIIHTMQLKRLLNATILGEPTGGKPSFYGGVDFRYLPSSCLRIGFSGSHRKTTLDEATANANTIMPDVLFPVTLASVTSGTMLFMIGY